MNERNSHSQGPLLCVARQDTEVLLISGANDLPLALQYQAQHHVSTHMRAYSTHVSFCVYSTHVHSYFQSLVSEFTVRDPAACFKLPWGVLPPSFPPFPPPSLLAMVESVWGMRHSTMHILFWGPPMLSGSVSAQDRGESPRDL